MMKSTIAIALIFGVMTALRARSSGINPRDTADGVDSDIAILHLGDALKDVKQDVSTVENQLGVQT